jgi:hypothetical protein
VSDVVLFAVPSDSNSSDIRLRDLRVIISGVGAVTGTSTANAVGSTAGTTESRTVTVSGTSTASGVGQSTVSAVASASGTSTASAVGANASAVVEEPKFGASSSRGRVVGFIPSERKKPKPAQEPKEPKEQRKQDDYQVAGPLGAIIDFPVREAPQLPIWTYTPTRKGDRYGLVAAGAALALEIDPMNEQLVKDFIEKLVAQASDAMAIAEEAKMMSQQVLNQTILQEEKEEVMNLKELESLLLLAMVD